MANNTPWSIKMASNEAESGSPSPDPVDPGGSSGGGGRGGKWRNWNGRSGTGNGKEARFTRKSKTLKHLVYDILTGKETFLKTTREIAKYVTWEYDDAKEFRIGMEDQLLPVLTEPHLPDADVSRVEFELWKIERNAYHKKKEARECNNG